MLSSIRDEDLISLALHLNVYTFPYTKRDTVYTLKAVPYTMYKICNVIDNNIHSVCNKV